MAQVPELEILQGPHVFASFSYVIASRGFHHYRVTTWPDVYDGEMVSVVRETDPNSLQHDRYACSVKRIKEGRGVLMARLVTVGHVPLEISKICHYFIIHGGEISGTVEDSKPRRSPIPSGGLEIKLNLTFKGRGDLIDKLKLLLRDAYNSTTGTTRVNRLKTKETTMKTMITKRMIFD